MKKKINFYLCFLVLFRSYVSCFFHLRVLGLGCLIMSSKTKLRTKPRIRNDRL